MNKKDLKVMAQKIANLEIKLQNAQSPEEKRIIEDAIFNLSGNVHSFEDMMQIDILVQEILEKQ